MSVNDGHLVRVLLLGALPCVVLSTNRAQGEADTQSVYLLGVPLVHLLLTLFRYHHFLHRLLQS